MIAQNRQFANAGYSIRTCTSQELDEIWPEIHNVSQTTEQMNHGHVGVIKREYKLTDARTLNMLSSIVGPMTQQYLQENHYAVQPGRQLGLAQAWVNLQAPGEYLAPHTHTSLFSFALWMSVPFTQSQEHEWHARQGKITQQGPAFTFYYTDSTGRVTPCNLPVDRTWEGRCVLFPSEMTHGVTPFYSTQEPRITVSGNIDYAN